MAYGVEESAHRFENVFHVLRELVHLTAGHLPLEPRFEVKALLAGHLYDDARATAKIRRRLDELDAPAPAAPSPTIEALLDGADHAGTAEYLEIAYGELKPTLIAALRIHRDRADPLADQPSLRLVTQLLHRQERHTTELPPTRTAIPIDDLGAQPVRRDGTRELVPLPPLDRPNRDDFVTIADADDEEPETLHTQLNAALCAAELAARNAHEHPELPLDFHVDMARIADDQLRHAEVLDRTLSEQGAHWGDRPVSLARFTAAYARDLPGRLAANGPRSDTGFFRADAALHELIATRWREALDRTEEPVRSS